VKRCGTAECSVASYCDCADSVEQRNVLYQVTVTVLCGTAECSVASYCDCADSVKERNVL
jgi:hypothetical protein